MTKAERLEMQKEKLQTMLQHERRLWASGRTYVAGVDEVGRGPLAGPVVAAAVILPQDFDVLGIDDSKKLSPKKREELYGLIKEKALAWAIGWQGPEVIDAVNILEATKKAMAEAVNVRKTAACADRRQLYRPCPGSAADCDRKGRRQFHVHRGGFDPGKGNAGPLHGGDGAAVSGLRVREQQGLWHEGALRRAEGPGTLSHPQKNFYI